VFESRSKPLLPRRDFYLRLARSAATALGVIAVSLAIGVVGYHRLAGLAWVDALLNASMILGGMGPVDLLHTGTAKVFASLYALFSGFALISSVSVVLAPVFHRFIHRFHLDEEGVD
jgi:hypothetical protein